MMQQETDKVPEILHGSCSFCVECGTSFGISAEHLSIFLQNNYQYFCRSRIRVFLQKTFSTFPENCPIVLQETPQHTFRTPFSVFAEHASVVLQNTSPFFEYIFQYFCKAPTSISRISIQQVCRTLLRIFAEYL